MRGSHGPVKVGERQSGPNADPTTSSCAHGYDERDCEFCDENEDHVEPNMTEAEYQWLVGG